jgi:subtilisin family serine protease
VEASAKLTASGATVLKTFSSDLFTGFSVESTTDNAESLELFKDVRRAWPSMRYSLDPLISQAPFATDKVAANYTVHPFTGVAKLHEAGIKGKGVTIAIVDTGTNYMHPAVRRTSLGRLSSCVSFSNSKPAWWRFWSRVQNFGGVRLGR